VRKVGGVPEEPFVEVPSLRGGLLQLKKFVNQAGGEGRLSCGAANFLTFGRGGRVVEKGRGKKFRRRKEINGPFWWRTTSSNPQTAKGALGEHSRRGESPEGGRKGASTPPKGGDKASYLWKVPSDHEKKKRKNSSRREEARGTITPKKRERRSARRQPPLPLLGKS